VEADLYPRILAARETLRGHAHITPIATSRTLNRLVGAEVFCKCENFQRVGAFKFRGAFNAVSRLTAAQKRSGVITFSSGNHAQAIALACQLLGVRATIVMPRDAPAAKRQATEGYGATVVLCEPTNPSREKVAAELQARHGLTLIPPFDHLDVIAGQGTAAAELCEQVPNLDWVITPCGGGGLLSGTAISVKTINSQSRVAGIEPEIADDAVRSFRTKTLQTVTNPPTIADGTRTASLGNYTFPLVLKYVDEMKTVTEDDIRNAVRFLFYRMKLVVEPSGALGIAALLSGAFRPAGRIGVILSGGNIDGAAMAAILNPPSTSPAAS